MATTRTLPDHDRCDTHRGYKLSCEQYESLIADSGQRCELCRKLSTETSYGKLYIDHEGHDWAVRGLLCTGCNSVIRTFKTFPPGTRKANYLLNAWWKRQCASAGLPTSKSPEPPTGSAIRDQFRIVWLHERDGKWRPHGQGKPGISWLSWEDIYRLRGPHNMAPFDLYGPESNEWLRWAAERATGARV